MLADPVISANLLALIKARQTYSHNGDNWITAGKL